MANLGPRVLSRLSAGSRCGTTPDPSGVGGQDATHTASDAIGHVRRDYMGDAGCLAVVDLEAPSAQGFHGCAASRCRNDSVAAPVLSEEVGVLRAGFRSRIELGGKPAGHRERGREERWVTGGEGEAHDGSLRESHQDGFPEGRPEAHESLDRRSELVSASGERTSEELRVVGQSGNREPSEAVAQRIRSLRNEHSERHGTVDGGGGNPRTIAPPVQQNDEGEFVIGVPHVPDDDLEIMKGADFPLFHVEAALHLRELLIRHVRIRFQGLPEQPGSRELDFEGADAPGRPLGVDRPLVALRNDQSPLRLEDRNGLPLVGRPHVAAEQRGAKGSEDDRGQTPHCLAGDSQERNPSARLKKLRTMGGMKRILVVDDEENIRIVLRTFLRRSGYEVEVAAGGEEALGLIDSFGPDFVITDVRMPRASGLDLLSTLKAKGSDATVIVMSAYGSHEQALEAIQMGAYDYVSKPFAPEEVLLCLRKAEEREALRRENRALRREIQDAARFENILAKSQAMENIFRTIAKVADYKTTVLITGESGVGKELVARALHSRSSRKNGPFVAVNCGAIPESLLESELFGHKRGAFTDAVSDRKGLFEEATGGTIFLDEIGEMPLSVQVKLLRVLEDERIRRLGESRDIQIDVRIVTATHRDLSAEVKAGRFREDLFYRLNVLHVAVPPLRERKEDISLLVEYFIDRNNKRLGTEISGVDSEARRLLYEYAWPGNVRELENTIERAMVLADGAQITAAELPERVRDVRDPIKVQLASGELSIKKTSRYIEEILIRRALHRTKGNRTRAAEILEISHRALLYKIKDFAITDL
jgi:two-component system response regulator AtoC